MAIQQNTSSNINLSLPADLSNSFKDPEVAGIANILVGAFNNLVKQLEQYLGITKKDITLWPFLGPSVTLLRHQQGRLYVIASEAIGYNAFVNLHNVAGVLNVRNANANGGKPARGYQNVTGGTALGARTEVILSQGLMTIAGLNPGEAIYLSTVNGQATIVAPTAAGNTEQFLGVGVAPNLAYIDISLGQYIQH